MDLTLLEVHLDGSTFTATAPLSGQEQSEDTPAGGDSGETGTRLLPFVIGLAGLAVLAYLVRRFKSGGGASPAEIEPDLSEPDAPTP